MNAVLEAVDTGEDLSNANAGTSADAGGNQAQVPGAAGAGAEGQQSAAAGAAAAGAGADTQSAAAGAGQTADGKLVPLAALHESREKIKTLTSQIDELRALPRLSAEDADLLKTLKEQRKAEAQPKDPDFLEDPKGYVDAKQAKIDAAIKRLDDANAESKTERQQQEQVSALMGAVQAHEAQFAAKTADYNDALAHVRTVRGNQLRLLAPQATDAQIMQQIGREELGAAHQVISAGGNPAEFAYSYAKTMGYMPKVAAAANGAAGGMQAAAQNVQQTPADKPDKNAVRTMGGGGGAEPADDDQGDAMPEFTAAVAERFGKKRK